MSSLPSTIGHNSGTAPLEEILGEETIDLIRRRDDLIAGAGRAQISDDETAGKAVTLAKLIKEHGKRIDEDRKSRKEPFLEGGRTVDRHFQNISAPLKTAEDSVVRKIDDYRRQKENEAATERRRLEEEARKAAIEAQRIAEAAREQPITVENEIALQTAQEEADRLTQMAGRTSAVTITSDYGFKAAGRKVENVVIDDFKIALKHALKFDEPAIHAAVQGVYDRMLKAKITNLPGAHIEADSKTFIR
jgi:hypothetical protein